MKNAQETYSTQKVRFHWNKVKRYHACAEVTHFLGGKERKFCETGTISFENPAIVELYLKNSTCNLYFEGNKKKFITSRSKAF